MKNLANCSGAEFLRQSNKIRHAVSSWLKDVKFFEIRKNKPSGIVEITDSMSDEDKVLADAENEKKWREQSKKNISDMLDLALETHAEETFKILAMMCFIEPEDAENHSAPELLANFAEMINDKDVVSFFTSLMKLDVMNTSSTAKG